MTSTIFDRIIKFIKEIYPEENPVPLHRPVFEGNEKKYLVECIDSGYVSSVGPLVKRLEELVCEFTGSPYSVATTNGTAALHISLLLSNVKPGDLVITQPLTFVAATNSIRYAGADPVFIDIDPVTLGLSHESLAEYIKHQTTPGKDGFLHERSTGKRISACLPVDTFGHPVKIDNLVDLCEAHHISLIEDATEAIGSFYKNHHAGTFGRIGVLSFNGNKTITTGGGGMILTKDKNIAEQARYLTTQAKKDHPWEYIHDDIGYNYRMPNINAALGCAQMEQLPGIIIRKRAIASRYQSFFQGSDIQFIMEPPDSLSNYWLNAILLKDKIERNRFLKFSHENGVLSRPAWRLINRLKMYNKSRVTNIHNAEWIADRLVNLPSSI